jgi:2-polyprenyl-3-methyl-5-hydroxy-6-metoxy-1,4-benzoquinol methylase
MDRDVTLADLFERLDRERQSADLRYNDALTALDRTQQDRQARLPLPSPPAFHDHSQVEPLNLGWRILPQGEPAADRSFRGRFRGFIWRVVGPALEAQQRFNAVVVDHVNRNAAAQDRAAHAAVALVEAARREIEALDRFRWLLLQFLQTITGYVDTKDRSGGGPELREQLALVQQRLAMVERELTRRIERRDATGAPHAERTTAQLPPVFTDLASVVYLGFEDRFRGTTGDIRKRLASYVPLFGEASNVLDVGCGRGELLELLRERGVTARGIDTNQAMVDECRSRGLEVERADALTFLEGQRDGSLGGLIAIQVVEHFEPAYLLRVLELAYQKLRPGAALVVETINPACWMAFFECYIRDLTHARPLHPDTLRYLVQATGFTAVNIEYRAPVTEADRLERVSIPAGIDPATAAVAAALNAHADKLNARLFSSMDYAVIARR